jgi:ribosomal protein S18 acetylase RimI-like enzyme
MFVRTLERENIREYVKLLFLCCSELKNIFGDEFIGREILESCYESFDSYEGILVAKAEKRLVGFVELKTSEIKRKFPIKPFLILGLSKGLKVRMLLSFFDRKPKKDEAYIRFIGVHPKMNSYEVGEILVDKAIEFASLRGKKKISAWLPVESDLVDICLEKGFEIRRMLESSFAEKYMGKKYYYLLEMKLND